MLTLQYKQTREYEIRNLFELSSILKGSKVKNKAMFKFKCLCCVYKVMKKYSPNAKQFYCNHMKSRYSLH